MMRWLIFLLVVIAVLWYLRGIDKAPPPTVEDSFIGEPVKALRKAEGLEKSYLDATKKHQQEMEEQLEKEK